MTRAARTRIKRVRESPMGWLYTAPALLVFAAFTIAPSAYTLYISFFKWNVLDTAKSKFIGLENYRTFVTGSNPPTFLAGAWHSLYFSGAMVLGGTAIGLGIALLLQRGGRLMNFGRVAVFSPHVTPIVATSVAWTWIFNPQYGLADALLRALHLPTSQWIFSATWAMPSVIVYSLWHELGLIVVLFLGGLAVVSPETSEAARVDGANAWQEFWYVTWPQLRPVVVFVMIVTAISSLQAFTQFYEMSAAPAYSTTTLSLLVYQEAFVFFDTGYGAALAVVLFLVTVAMSLLGRRTNSSVARSS